MTDEERRGPSHTPPTAGQSQSVGGAVYTEVRVTHASGPVPLPSILAAYNQAVPNGAERVLALAEQEAAHRHAIERTALQAQTRIAMLGVTIAGGSIVLFAGIAVWCLATGRGTAAIAALLVPLSILVGSVLGNFKRSDTSAPKDTMKGER